MLDNLPFLQGGGELGELIRATDWSATTIGTPDTWPESLRSAVAISLSSGFPIAIYWGPDFTLIYNEAWSSIPGQKHPWALGKPGEIVWPEIWDGLKHEFESVLLAGQSYRRPDAPLYMHRYGYTEECYFDYTLSPIVATDGSVGGVFNAVVETSYRVINERRNHIRHAFLAQAHTAQSVPAAILQLEQLFSQATLDIPCYALFTFSTKETEAQKVASFGLSEAQIEALTHILSTGTTEDVRHLTDLEHLTGTPVSCPHWPEPVTEALVLPFGTGETNIKGYLFVGASPRKRIDSDYQNFLIAVTANTSAILNNAFSVEISAAYQEELVINAELTRDLASSESRLRNMVMAAHYPLMILEGEEFIVSIANQPLATLWNKTMDQINGRALLDILPELHQQPFPVLLRKVYDSGEAYAQEEEVFYLQTENGTATKYVSFAYQPLKDGEGKVNAIVVTANDITEIVKIRKLLEESYEEQQVLNEEITAANEELAASNEELATTNEELSEIQAQLQETMGWLSESEQRFRNLIREATVGIILLSGHEMTVKVVNQAYGRFVRCNVEELQDKPLFEVLPDAEVFFKDAVSRVIESGEPVYLYDQPYSAQEAGNPVEGFLNVIYQPYREADGKVTGILILCQDVTDQVKARKLIADTEKRFQVMLNAIPQQVWTALPDGKLNYVNQVVSGDFGVAADEIAGQGWQAFIHPDDLPRCLLEWERALTSSTEYLTEFRLRFLNGEYVWHLSRAVPLIENGVVTLWLGTNTNIELQKQNEQRKDEFLSIASHELKTPLTGIKAFNQLMKRSPDPKRTSSYIEKSTENINRLEKLINDLLDVTKINAGKLSYDMQPFDFAQLLKDSVDSVQLTTTTHQIKLEDPGQLSYTGDRLRLEQVVNNFLSNAIKYSPGASEVLMKCWVEENGLIVSVKDFGIGIEQEHLKHLFDRYYRIDNTEMRFEGLGLGLFISSEILKRHSGSFWIESTPGAGSTFYFRLPFAGPDVEKPADQHDDQFYQDAHITIVHPKENDWLEIDWTGFQDVDSVKSGGARILEIMRNSGVHKVLNDNTNVSGTWSEAADWTGQHWFPEMEKAGLRYFAWIYSPSMFSRLSAEKAVDAKIGNTVIQFFTDVASARKWLAEKTT